MVDNRILELSARLSGDEDLQKFINNVSRLEKETYLASASAQRANRAFAKFVKDSSKIEGLRKEIHRTRAELEKFKDANDITNPDVYAKMGEQYLQLKNTLEGLNQQYDSLTNNVQRCYDEMMKANEEYRTDLLDTGILASGVNLFEIIMGRNADKVPDDPLGALLGIDKDVLQKYSESYSRSISDLKDQLLKLYASRPHGDIIDESDFEEERAEKIRETQKAIRELTDAHRLLVRVMDIQIQRQKILSAEQEAYSLQQRQMIADQIVADYHQLIGTGVGTHEGKQTNVLDIVQERTEGSLKENPYKELLSTNPEELKEKYAYFQNALANIQKQRTLVSSLSPEATGAPEESRARQKEDLKRLDQVYRELHNSMKLIEDVVQEQMDTGLFSETFGERGKSLKNTIMGIAHGLLGVQSTALGDAAALRELGTAIDYLTNKQNRQSYSLEGLMRKHRWIQSYLLVTGNFMAKLGNGVAVLGAILRLITLPAILLLTIFLAPFIPIIAGIVKGLTDWIIKLSELPDWIKLVVGGIILMAVSSGALVMVVKKIWDMITWTKYFIDILRMSGVFSPLVTSGKAAFTLLIGYAKTAAIAVINIGKAALVTAARLLLPVAAGLLLGGVVLLALDYLGVLQRISDAGKEWRDSNRETVSALLDGLSEGISMLGVFGAALNLVGDLYNATIGKITGNTILTANRRKELIGLGIYNEEIMKQLRADYGEGNVKYEGGSYYVNGERLTISVDMGAYEQSVATNSQSMDNVTDATKENTSLLSENISLMKDEINGLKDLNISFSDLSKDLNDFSEEIDLEEPLGEVSDELINNTAALSTYNKLFEDYSKSIDTQKANVTQTIPAAATGAEVKRTGLLTVHAGEKVIPADISRKIDSGSLFGKLTEMIMGAVQAPTILNTSATNISKSISSTSNISEAITNNSVTNEVRNITTSITNNNQRMRAPKKEEESPARIELIYNGHAFIDSYVDRRVKEILNHIGVRI